MAGGGRQGGDEEDKGMKETSLLDFQLGLTVDA